MSDIHAGAEAQGGSTYCGLAAIVLMNKLKDVDDELLQKLEDWCMKRQVHGYQGRTNKDADSCYSFWIGGSLSLLHSFGDTDIPSTKNFLLNDCQFSYGGFCKVPDAYPDVLHTFYSICWLSLSKEFESFKDLDVKYGISTVAAARIHK